jgi:molybdenum cofactor cytidylyltransferase
MTGQPQGRQAPHPVAAVILAAGQSRRLGHPKQLVLFRGEALVHRAARAAVEAGLDPVVVVIAPGADAVRRAVADLPVEVVENPAAEAGMGTSVSLGVTQLRRRGPERGVLLIVCDQPLLDAHHLAAIVAARQQTGSPVVASEYGGVKGVPVLVGPEILDEVAALDGDRGARDIVRRDPARVTAVPFPGGAVDVDTAEDLERARRRE